MPAKATPPINMCFGQTLGTRQGLFRRGQWFVQFQLYQAGLLEDDTWGGGAGLSSSCRDTQRSAVNSIGSKFTEVYAAQRSAGLYRIYQHPGPRLFCQGENKAGNLIGEHVAGRFLASNHLLLSQKYTFSPHFSS